MSKRLIGLTALLLTLAALAAAGGAAAQPAGRPAPHPAPGKPGSRPPSPAPGKPGSRPPSPAPSKPGGRPPFTDAKIIVVRGGLCKPDSFTKGTGVETDAQGKLSGVSVNAAAGLTLEQLTTTIRHNQVGVTTVGAIQEAGGQVVPDPTKGNPNHALVSGVSAAQLSQLFAQGLQKNPTKVNPKTPKPTPPPQQPNTNPRTGSPRRAPKPKAA
jgi:hypothetical protein